MPQYPTGTATPALIVDAMKALAGHRSKVRASFARGRCVRGAYIPSDQAKEITTSRSFNRPSRVLARFSIHGSVTNSDNLALRGFSFRLGEPRHRSDIVAQSAPVHYARTLDQMLAFLTVRMPGPDGRPDPEKLEAFAATNPETLHLANYIAATPLPRSFAGTTYWGVHAFPATNSNRETRFIKFKVAPVGVDATPTDEEAKGTSPDDLHHELQNRIAAGDVRFSVLALLGCPDDPTLDVTIRWPHEDDREAVRLGTIVITAVEPNEACDAIIFDPGNLAEGICHPPDEIFAARSAAYAISLAKRR
jgi:catalase